MACAVPAAAQTVAQQQARVDSLGARMQSLDARLDSLGRLDETIEVERVRFVVRPEYRAQAQEAARLALDTLARILGPTDRHLLDGWVTSELRNGWPGSDGRTRAVAGVVRAAGEQRLQPLSGTQLRAWSRWWTPEAYDLQRAYLDLVTAPAAAATRCFEGDLDACAGVLDVVPVTDPWRELLSADDRRAWATNRREWMLSLPGPQGERRAEQHHRCVDEREDQACLALLRDALVDFPPLVSARTPRSVILVARRLGGDGAFSRLLADTTAALGVRLAAAAGVPLDSLLRTWHGAVLAAAPPPTRAGTRSAWTSVLVVVALCGLALRSTRWR